MVVQTMKRLSLTLVLAGMVGFSIACGGGEAEPEVILIPVADDGVEADVEDEEADDEEADVEDEEAEATPKMTDEDRRHANETKSLGREPNAGEQHNTKKTDTTTTGKKTTTTTSKKTGGTTTKKSSGGTTTKKSSGGTSGKKSGQ